MFGNAKAVKRLFYSPAADVFTMFVHSCYVDDGSGHINKLIVDEKGLENTSEITLRCSLDTDIIPDLVYNEEGNLAFSETKVFKFADKSTTSFQCLISACRKSTGLCNDRTVTLTASIVAVSPLRRTSTEVCLSKAKACDGWMVSHHPIASSC